MQASYTATFSSKGQLTFPVAIRARLGIKAGHKATITRHPKKKNTYTLTFKETPSMESLFGALHKPGMKYIPIEEAREIAGRALGEKYAIT
jgi:bifunctional DNA-binding transcriptional regulator/antitoxin component of YhaV-PrlF toxin-antitoxin module